MPVMTKEQHRKLYTEIQRRTAALLDAFEARELKSTSEGARGGQWAYPDRMCVTNGDILRLSLAVNDFKDVLSDIKRLK